MIKREAERQIEKILMKLEMDTHTLVERIHIEDIDVTSIDSIHPYDIRTRVDIDLRPQPGRRWDRGE